MLQSEHAKVLPLERRVEVEARICDLDLDDPMCDEIVKLAERPGAAGVLGRVLIPAAETVMRHG